MTILTLSAKQDHLEKIAKTSDPIKAISEYVWNALDADAVEVRVDLVRNALEGIEEIVIQDNGDGITLDRAKTAYENLGESWKKKAHRTSKKRPLHGKEGQGRLRFYSLAEKAQWKTTYVEGEKVKDLFIEIRSASLDKCNISEPQEAADSRTGTTVTLSSLKEQFAWLLSEQAYLNL